MSLTNHIVIAVRGINEAHSLVRDLQKRYRFGSRCALHIGEAVVNGGDENETLSSVRLAGPAERVDNEWMLVSVRLRVGDAERVERALLRVP